MADDRTSEELARDEAIGRRLQAELPVPRQPGPTERRVLQAVDDAMPTSPVWDVTQELGCLAMVLAPFRFVWKRTTRSLDEIERGERRAR